MKPIYIVLVMWALFITGLVDGISWALAALPGVGIVLDFVIAVSINSTMGAGLLFLLVINGMYHPKFGSFFTIGGLIPPFNFLPMWLGLVIAGIAQDMSKEKGLLGDAAKVATAVQSGKNPLGTVRAVTDIAMNERRATGRPPQAANDNKPEPQQEQSHVSLNLKTAGMHSDIAPPRAANNNFPYAQQKAA